MPKIGNSSLKELVDNFLPNIYPTTATADPNEKPTSVSVYGIVKETESSDNKKNTPLDSLAFSDLVNVLAGYTFKVTRYDNGDPGPSGVYSVTIQSADQTATGQLSADDIVNALGKNPVAISLGGGAPSYYRIANSLDVAEHNGDLGKPIGPFGAKYLFLLKKMYKFTVTSVTASNQPTGGPVIFRTMDGSKTFNE